MLELLHKVSCHISRKVFNNENNVICLYFIFMWKEMDVQK